MTRIVSVATGPSTDRSQCRYEDGSVQSSTSTPWSRPWSRILPLLAPVNYCRHIRVATSRSCHRSLALGSAVVRRRAPRTSGWHRRPTPRAGSSNSALARRPGQPSAAGDGDLRIDEREVPPFVDQLVRATNRASSPRWRAAPEGTQEVLVAEASTSRSTPVRAAPRRCQSPSRANTTAPNSSRSSSTSFQPSLMRDAPRRPEANPATQLSALTFPLSSTTQTTSQDARCRPLTGCGPSAPRWTASRRHPQGHGGIGPELQRRRLGHGSSPLATVSRTAIVYTHAPLRQEVVIGRVASRSSSPPAPSTTYLVPAVGAEGPGGVAVVEQRLGPAIRPVTGE